MRKLILMGVLMSVQLMAVEPLVEAYEWEYKSTKEKVDAAEYAYEMRVYDKKSDEEFKRFMKNKDYLYVYREVEREMIAMGMR